MHLVNAKHIELSVYTDGMLLINMCINIILCVLHKDYIRIIFNNIASH